MSPKITAEHLGRGAAVYVRQSSPGQVASHTESRRRQYDLADAARAVGFVDVMIIDEDLGRSGIGLEARPGFQRFGGGGLAAPLARPFLHRGLTAGPQRPGLAPPH